MVDLMFVSCLMILTVGTYNICEETMGTLCREEATEGEIADLDSFLTESEWPQPTSGYSLHPPLRPPLQIPMDLTPMVS